MLLDQVMGVSRKKCEIGVLSGLVLFGGEGWSDRLPLMLGVSFPRLLSQSTTDRAS